MAREAPGGLARGEAQDRLLAVLGAAAGRAARSGIARDLLASSTRRGSYRGSGEELTPRPWQDPRSLLLLAVTAATVLVRPATWTLFAGGAVNRYALAPEAWTSILEHASLPAEPSPGSAPVAPTPSA